MFGYMPLEAESPLATQKEDKPLQKGLKTVCPI